MFKELKKRIRNKISRKPRVVFISIFSFDGLPAEHWENIFNMLRKYGKKNKLEFAVIGNSLVRPLDKSEIRELFDTVYKNAKGDN